MIKKVIVLALAAFIGTSLMAQTVQETTTMVGEKTVTAYTVSLQKDVKMVQEAMNQRLKDAKLKTKKSEGFIAALDQVFTDISQNSLSVWMRLGVSVRIFVMALRRSLRLIFSIRIASILYGLAAGPRVLRTIPNIF